MTQLLLRARPQPRLRAHPIGERWSDRQPDRAAGQVLVIFAGAIVALMGLSALVVDVSWYWASTLRVQRAADAAAMAGAVWLPGNTSQAYAAARAEATKNGYTAGGEVTVTPIQDSRAPGGVNPRQLNVTISAPVGTYFARAVGISSFTATRTAKAEYVQGVPMGSPLAYYGVYRNCKVSGSSITCSDLPHAAGGGTIPSQGFFGAIEGQGSNRSTGDAFATGYNSDPTANSQYDPKGYDYMIEVPSDGATVYIWDPTFCATTSGPGGGHLGAGDHWLSTANHSAAVPTSTYFRLWDTRGTQFTTSDDTRADPTGDDLLFANRRQVDKSAAYSQAATAGGQNNDFSDGSEPNVTGVGDCQADPYHNAWWPLASGLPAGIYRLQVTTTDPSNPTANRSQAFENMWSLEVVGGGAPRIFGAGRMVSYANIESGTQLFYLAEIDQRVGAGKTVVIDLFDPGDVGDKAWLQILSPDGNAYAPVRFSWTADGNAAAGHRSGANVNCIQTYGNGSAVSPPAGCADNYTSGGQFFQNSWIRIEVPLSESYGSTGLRPPGEPADGWWKIKYTVNKGNDTTTWMVSLRGNPVHLVVP